MFTTYYFAISFVVYFSLMYINDKLCFLLNYNQNKSCGLYYIHSKMLNTNKKIIGQYEIAKEQTTNFGRKKTK